METLPEPEPVTNFILAQANHFELVALDTASVIAVVSILVLMFISAMISGSEVAFFGLSFNERAQLREETAPSSKRIIQLLQKSKHLLATILIANNLVNIGIIVSSYFIVEQVVETNITWVQFLIEVVFVTFLIVLFGEIIPKFYATQNQLSFARVMARPLKWLGVVFYPLAVGLAYSTSVIDRRLEKKFGKNVTASDIDEAIDLAAGHETSKQEVDILKGIVKFGNISAKQIMRSRLDIIGISETADLQELYDLVVDSGFSRIPIMGEDLDDIKGIIYAKDLLRYENSENKEPWQSLMRPPFFVPENKKVEDLLRKFQQKRMHLAIVVDEYGGTSGLVTLEDVMEEIIGEIKDEFDDFQEIDFKKIDNKNYTFEGKTLINDMCRVINIPIENFDVIRGDADSLAGLLLEVIKRFPKEGESRVIQGYTFTVEAVSNSRVERIKVTLK